MPKAGPVDNRRSVAHGGAVKTLVLAEKPSVGRELARVLGCARSSREYIDGDRYVVTWAMGHLVELADPGEYDDKWERWSLETLPMLPPRMRHRVIRRTSGQFRAIKSLLGRAEVGEVIIATDAGREGELVARWILMMAAWKGAVRRLWISSQTDAAIRAGFATLRPGRDYEPLWRAAECRSEADWLVGLNVTRALSCKFDARLSAGRVQTPTLAMIVDREKEIQVFKPVPYWVVEADFGAYRGAWRGSKGEARIDDEARALAVVAAVRGTVGVIRSVEEAEKAEPPPLLFDLGALQTAANAALGFGAKKTLDVLQALYERHKILTYPRTDSRYLTADVAATIPARLAALSGTPLGPVAAALKGARPGKRHVDDAKVSDHHAIIPTEEPVRPDRLSTEERALWELVARRFLAALSGAHRYRAVTLVTEAGGHRFVTRGREVIEQGWRAVDRPAQDADEDDEDQPESQKLDRHAVGEKHGVLSVESRQKMTRPPPRYTEGTLIAAMENAGKRITDQELRQSILATGIGTPATRAEIIEKILSNHYVEKHGKELAPTTRGTELVGLVPEELRSPLLTARWEQRLGRIARAEEDPEVFRADIRRNTAELVRAVVSSTAKYEPEGAGGRCPMCGKAMLEFPDRRGRRTLVCQSLSCGWEQRAGREDDAGPGRVSPRERAIGRRLVREYSADASETATLGDLLKASRKRNEKN